jgi:hypothetical protein
MQKATAFGAMYCRRGRNVEVVIAGGRKGTGKVLARSGLLPMFPSDGVLRSMCEQVARDTGRVVFMPRMVLEADLRIEWKDFGGGDKGWQFSSSGEVWFRSCKS